MSFLDHGLDNSVIPKRTRGTEFEKSVSKRGRNRYIYFKKQQMALMSAMAFERKKVRLNEYRGAPRSFVKII